MRVSVILRLLLAMGAIILVADDRTIIATRLIESSKEAN